MGSDPARGDRYLDAREASTDEIPLASTCSSQCFSAAHDRSSYDCGGVSMIPVQPSASQKITARHLSRQAMLYVRQSTLHQVLENPESTARQYGLRERAIALGWEASRIVVMIRTWANREQAPSIGLDFNGSWPRWGLAMSGSSWDWRSPG